MKNYKECSDEEFEAAMAEKDKTVTEISDEHLYILFTKYRADVNQLLINTAFSRDNSYSNSILDKTKEKRDAYFAELSQRNIEIKE